MTSLLRYDAACRALAEAKTFDEVTSWIDKAAAVREYTRRIKNRQLEIDAIEIRVRAKKRRGELLIQLKQSGQLREGKPQTVTSEGQLQQITLEELDISRNESSEEQQIAQIDSDSFERLIARCRAYAEAHPEKHSFDVLKPPPDGGPINGARSIMGSRQEPDDSLDYFPTPPWATRALMEAVFPHLRLDLSGRSILEPACGEGHIAEVLCEYSNNVHTSDIFNYGYSEETHDFLKVEFPKGGGPDWIITNPPFGENAILFVRHALALSRIGVAMFFRSQWAVEGIERYREIFQWFPPTLCAFFVERVNLCKGRWEPQGTTATAYCWLVWVQGQKPNPPFWIPPGCREALTHPDDAERFTAHPVIRKRHHFDSDGKPVNHDNDTGEVITFPLEQRMEA